MGCGHSKINIYSKRSRNKNNSKKTVAPEKAEIEEEEAVDVEEENQEKIDDCDRKTIKVKPFGGPLLAATELSTSQNNFFKMLDQKIESGPDYDSSSEMEKALEQARLAALLRDWETASAGSRSLPATPKRRPTREKPKQEISTEVPPNRPIEHRIYNPHPHPQSVVHQSYGVSQGVQGVQGAQGPYRQPYTPVYSSPPHQSQYQSTMQYQAISPMYSSQPQQSYQRQYSTHYQNQSNQSSPVKNYTTNSPKHIPFDASSYSPNHKVYTSISKTRLTNGDLMQQQFYQQHVQYQHPSHIPTLPHLQNSRDYQYKREPNYSTRSYQSSVHIPIVPAIPTHNQSDLREQYELT